MPEFTLTGTAGTQLHVHVWEAQTPRAIAVIAHGYGEHAGRYAHVADRLTAAGMLVVAPDHHGHGRSSGPRAQIDFGRAVADLDQIIVGQHELHPTLPVMLIGHSMGGGIALRYAIAHGDRLRGLALSGPLVQVAANPVSKLVGQLLAGVLPGAPVAKLDPALVSRDPAVVADYEADPLNHHGGVPARTAAQFVAHGDSILADAAQITLPVLLMWGTADGLCPPAGAEALAAALTRAELTTRAFPGLYHEIFMEPERDAVLDTLVTWLDAHR
ncbi:MAG TPA: alpha/beta hydrolase [Solirubrobacteraceae bacterium]|nr:alpha/beta hydrolase [Solirubrobacteraceae bacterium]